MLKYSFIIPVYNCEKYIERCINSVLALQRNDMEIIVINDGSTDSTGEILARIKGKCAKVKVFDIENSGLSVARNTGIEKASGEYLIFVDSDDWINKEIEDPMLVACVDNLDVCFYNALDVYSEEDDSTCYQLLYNINEDVVYDGEGILKWYSKQDILHETWRGVYKKSFLVDNNISFIPGILYEDSPFWFDIMLKAKRVKYLDTYCYMYFRHSDSIIYTRTNKKNVDSVFSVMDYVYSRKSFSKNYLGYAAVKMHRLMKSCEKNIDTSSLDELIADVGNVLERKKNIFDRIDSIYSEDDISSLMNKYVVLSELSFFLGVFDEAIKKRIFELRKKVIVQYKNRMKNWSLNDEKKIVGIYGGGRCSDVLLDIYSAIFGEIKAKLYYIDSKLETKTAKHFDKDIINVSDVNKFGVDEIIICSIRYEKEIYNTAKKHCQIPIHCFFDGDEFITENTLANNFVEIAKSFRETEGKKRILLFETPEYDNIGDHLITYAQKCFFEKNFSDYEIIEVDNIENHFYKGRLSRFVKDSDIIVINGGGNFGSLWRITHYDESLDIIKNYKNNQVFVMPQSVFFHQNDIGEKYIKLTQEIFDRDKLTICVREHFSYETLVSIGIDKNKILLLPDIVLSLEDSDIVSEAEKNKETKGDKRICFFTRYDKEAVATNDDFEKLKYYMDKCGMNRSKSTMLYGNTIPKRMRNYAILELLKRIDTEYDLIVTDQLHCMIVCALLKKPCLVFKSISKKTEGVYEWIKHLEYIKIANEDAVEELEFLLKLTDKEKEGSFNLNKEWKMLYEKFYSISEGDSL